MRSERQLTEQVTYNMLFRWFIGLSMDAPAWDVTVFTKNLDRLLDGDVAASFLLAVMSDPAVKRLLSTAHFLVDGTLIDAWAELAKVPPAERWMLAEGSMKSFRRKDGQHDPPSGPGRNAERDFRGEKRSNEMHASTTDPDARLYRSTDRLRRCGAAVKNLAHSASFHSREKSAPSTPGIKHLVQARHGL